MIEEFNFQSREAPFDPLSAILFKVLQVTAFLFFIAFLAWRSRGHGKDRHQGRVLRLHDVAGQPSRRL